MVSPVSPKSKAHHPPDIWLTCVDDTFKEFQENEVAYFTHHLNSMDENINFTVEPEQDSTLDFLDTCMKDEGSTRLIHI